MAVVSPVIILTQRDGIGDFDGLTSKLDYLRTSA